MISNVSFGFIFLKAGVASGVTSDIVYLFTGLSRTVASTLSMGVPRTPDREPTCDPVLELLAQEEGSHGTDVEGGRGKVVGDRETGFGPAPRGPDKGCAGKGGGVRGTHRRGELWFVAYAMV